MKLLLFSDVHADLEAARRIVAKSRDVDVVIGAGDFATMSRGLKRCIDVLSQIDQPTILVPGNNEWPDELVAACADWKLVHVLHGSGTEIEGVWFFGLGGGVPVTPFGDWSFDLSEEQAAKLLEACPDGAVLVSHSPPKGLVDRSSSGQSLGSTAVRDLIVQKKPLLVVSGHIHASAGKSVTFNRTPVVNAGPAGIIWEMPQIVDS